MKRIAKITIVLKKKLSRWEKRGMSSEKIEGKKLDYSYLAKVIKPTRLAHAAKSIRDNLYTSTSAVQKHVFDVYRPIQGGLSVDTRIFSVLETRASLTVGLYNNRNSTLPDIY